MGREMDEKMTTSSLEKILKAKKAEERAIENAEMKMLHSAYVESGLRIEEAIQLLKDHGKVHCNESCEKQPKNRMNYKSAEDIRQGKRAREERAKEQSNKLPNNEHSKSTTSPERGTKPEKPAFL